MTGYPDQHKAINKAADISYRSTKDALDMIRMGAARENWSQSEHKNTMHVAQ